MARCDHLPIWKDAASLAALLEEAVRRFPRYHKYALGTDLRRQAYAVCRAVVVANGEREGRACVIVREKGYLKHGRKRRVLSEIGWSTASRASAQIKVLVSGVASPSGVHHVP